MKDFDHWRKTALEELIQTEYPICYGVLKPGNYDDSGVPLLRIVDLESNVVKDVGLHQITRKLDNEFSRSKLKGGELLVSIQGTVGRVAIAPEWAAGANISRTIARVAIAREKGNAQFIRQWLLSGFGSKALKDSILGTTRDSLNLSALRKIQIPLPSPPEQTKIADILSTVDRAIEQTETLIAKQQRIKTGLMQDLLTRGIDEHGNLRLEQTHEFKDSPLGRIPVEWEVTDWGSVGYWKGGSTPSKGDPRNWIEGINLWVSPKDIRAPILETTEDLLTDRALTVSKLNVFQAGSIFTVFRSGILKHTIPISTCSKPFSVNQDIKVLIPKSETNIIFLKYLLRYCSPDILRTAVKAGTTVESIDRLVFEGMKIPRPDLPEQIRISDVLGQQESTSITLKSELLKFRSLKTALMQDLLTGKKRVTALLNNTEKVTS